MVLLLSINGSLYQLDIKRHRYRRHMKIAHLTAQLQIDVE